MSRAKSTAALFAVFMGAVAAQPMPPSVPSGPKVVGARTALIAPRVNGAPASSVVDAQARRDRASKVAAAVARKQGETASAAAANLK